MAGVNGWQGWQWMFLLQGLPTAALGVPVWRYLDDRVKDAAWLSPDERELIARDIAADGTGKSEASIWRVMANGRVWLLALVYLVFLTNKLARIPRVAHLKSSFALKAIMVRQAPLV
jgi:hypothetical protein